MSRYRVTVCRECPERHAIVSGGHLVTAVWAESVESALSMIAEAEARGLAGGDWRLSESFEGTVVAKRVALPHTPPQGVLDAEAGRGQRFRSWGECARFMRVWRKQETARLEVVARLREALS